jgi:peptidoglycan/xylan/chitin deacetylase (PgdA/CDA1 family)
MTALPASRRLPAVAALVVALLFPSTVSANPGAVVLAHGPRTRHEVALTFDDGWGTRACGALVDILEAARTPATFFPNAMYVRGSPGLWRRVAALGFPIGNHTTSHPLMTRLSYARQLAQIVSDRSIVERVLGVRTIPVFRPPYGAFNGATVAAAGAAGYAYVLNWDATFADSSRRRNRRAWPIAAYVRAATRGTSGTVVLGHCGSTIDLAALPGVIADYRARGFTFVTVPQLLSMPGAVPMSFPDPPAPPPDPPRAAGPPRAL